MQSAVLRKQLPKAQTPIPIHEHGHGEQDHVPQNPRSLLCGHDHSVLEQEEE